MNFIHIIINSSLWICFSLSHSLQAQIIQDSWRFKDTIHISADQVFMDQLSRIFVFSAKEKKLSIVDQLSNPLVVHTNRDFSKNTFIDASNPYKILIYYPEASRIQFLDKFLAVLTERNIGEMSQSDAVGVNTGGELMYFKDSRIHIEQISPVEPIESQSIFFDRTDAYLGGVKLLQCQQNYFLLIPGKGLMIFDSFLNLVGEYSNHEIKLIMTDRNEIYLSNGIDIFVWDLKKHEAIAIFHSHEPIQSFAIMGQKLLICDERHRVILYENQNR